MPTTWFRFPFAKYEAQTKDFSALEHGIYLKLIIHYFTIGGPIPDDMERLKRITGVSGHRSESIEFVLAKLFTHMGCAYENTFANEELKRMRELSDAQSTNALCRWNPAADAAAMPMAMPGNGANNGYKYPTEQRADAYKQTIVNSLRKRVGERTQSMRPELEDEADPRTDR